MDGSEPAALAVQLEDVPALKVLVTSVKVTDPARVIPGTAVAACLGGLAGPDGPIVARVGAVSSSVTTRTSDGRAIEACDDALGVREEGRKWCGGAYGQLYDGRLRDPRLDIGCRTEADEIVGFVWVQPAERVRYVSVEQPGYVEVYEVAAGLPVRISTRSGVQVEGSRASFDLYEHDATGQLLRRYRLEAAVAG